MTPAEVAHRDMAARQAVLRQLEEAYDAWSAQEERFSELGDYTNSAGAHRLRQYILRAIEAEKRQEPRA
jgi:hypothetical protein